MIDKIIEVIKITYPLLDGDYYRPIVRNIADAILKTIRESLPEEKDSKDNFISMNECWCEDGYNQYRKELLEKLK